jgi:hypothetical protein
LCPRVVGRMQVVAPDDEADLSTESSPPPTGQGRKRVSSENLRRDLCRYRRWIATVEAREKRGRLGLEAAAKYGEF